MKDYKIIISDIDGTLLNSSRQVSEATKEVIIAARKKGILFGLASGRPIHGIESNLEQWGIDGLVDFIIGSNGGERLSNNKYHQNHLLSDVFIHEILEVYEPLQLNACIYYKDALYVERIDEITAQIAKNVKLELVVCNMKETVKEPLNKLLYIVNADEMHRVEAFYQKHKNPNYRGFRSQAELFEFVNADVSKAFAIHELCDELHISIEEVIAFGDTSNDIEMLRECGLGVCMANGTQDAKEVADELTLSNDENGLAYYINTHLL